MRTVLFILAFLTELITSTIIAATPSSNYQNIIITQPTNEATIQYDEGKVCIKVNIAPALKTGDKLVLFLDGRSVREQQQNIPFCIYQVERGEHHLLAKIMTPNNDAPAIVSQPITFFMHQTSIVK
jgi:hypothetical protein